MTDPGAGARLERIASRLEELARLLPDADDERAVELAREAADLAAEAGGELDRGRRELSRRSGPGQEELL